MNTIIHSITIVTMDEKNTIIDGYVSIKDNLFSEIIEGDPPHEIIEKADEVIDGKGKWLLPGLINTHGHLGSSFLRGAGDDIPLMQWLETVMWPNERTFDKTIVKNAASLALLEMVKAGTTTFLDMYHLHMEEVADLVLKSNMRAVLCRGMIGNCSLEEQKAKIEESVQLHRHVSKQKNSKITVALSPHSPYTCPPSFIELVVGEAKLHNLWIHTHLSETAGEVERHEQQYNIRPVKHMEQIGLFQVPCTIAHGVHVNEEEMDILAENGVSVSHNPKSNLKLGSGIAPIQDMVKKGINVAIGTDSTASNNTLDMFEELRFAALIPKGVYEDPTVTTSGSILRMATVHGAMALQIEKLGSIIVGNKADFILIDPYKAHLSPWNHQRIQSHLVYAAKSSDVTDVYVDGKPLMVNRELIFMDEEKIIYNANKYLKGLST